MTINFFPCLADDQLNRAIGKLERFVRSLDRAGHVPLAEGYRRALQLATAERERRGQPTDSLNPATRR